MENNPLVSNGIMVPVSGSQTQKPAKVGWSVSETNSVSNNQAEDSVNTLLASRVNQTDKLSREAIDAAVRKVTEEIESRKIQLNISVNEKLNRFIVQINDKRTGETIKQYPSEDFISAAENLKDLTGILFNRDV